MKKLLSLVLAISLVLGSFSMAFAATPSDVTDPKVAAAVNKLMGLGIVNGYTDGTYKPEKVVTRAEMAKLLVVALGYDKYVDFYKGVSLFNDVEGWAIPYVNLAKDKGLIQGYTDGTFKPNNTVTYAEAVTMMLRAMGYEDRALKGTWPMNFVTLADDNKLFVDVEYKAGGANRGDVALLFNALLNLYFVSVDADGNLVVPAEEDREILLSKTGTLVKDQFITDTYLADNEYTSVVDLDLYSVVDVYMKGDVVVHVDKVYTVTYDGVASDDLTVIPAGEKEGKDFTVAGTIPVMLNGVATTFDQNGLEDADVTVVYVDNSTETTESYDVKGIYATLAEANYVVIEDVYDAETSVNRLDSIKLPEKAAKDEDGNPITVLDTDNVTVEGDATNVEDIAVDDVVYVFYGKALAGDAEPTKVRLHVIRDTFTGTVGGFKYVSGVATKVIIDGNTFAIPATMTKADFELGKEVSMILDIDGKLVTFVTPETVEEAKPENYAVVVIAPQAGEQEIEQDTVYGQGTVYTSELTLPKVQLLTADGKKVVYEVAAGLITNIVDKDDYAANVGTIALTMETAVVGDNLVKYELNEDGQIAKLELVATNGAVDKVYDADNKVFDTNKLFTEDTLVFDVEDMKVYTVADINDSNEVEYSHLILTANTDEVAVLVVTADLDTDAVVEEDAVYAIITDIVQLPNDADGNEVYEVTTLVDGVETVYSTDDIADLDGFVKLTLENNEITAVEDADVSLTDAAITVEKVTGNLVKGTVYYTASEDVVVYELIDGEYAVKSFSDLAKDVEATLYINAKDQVTYIIITAYPAE